MPELFEPTPALLLVLADIRPKDETRVSVKKCRKRVDRLRTSLGARPGGVLPLQPSGRSAIAALDARCLQCGRCAIMRLRT